MECRPADTCELGEFCGVRLDAEDWREFPLIGWPVCLRRSDKIMRHEPGPDLLPVQAQLPNSVRFLMISDHVVQRSVHRRPQPVAQGRSELLFNRAVEL